MSSLLDRATPEAPAGRRGEPGLPVAPRSRRPIVTVASALVVVASTAIFTSIYQSADHREPVLSVVSTIRQGQPFKASDLGTADVATSAGVSTIPASGAAELAGKRASVTIPAGSLLTPADVASGRSLATGSAVVGLALKEGQLPSDGVAPGDSVMLVQTPPPGSSLPIAGPGATATADPTSAAGGDGVAVAGVLVARATVFGTSDGAPSSSSGTSELVSVEVPSALAAPVAAAAAASEVSVVLLPAAVAAPGAESGSR